MDIKRKKICSSVLRNALVNYKDYYPISYARAHSNLISENCTMKRIPKPIRSSSVHTQRIYDNGSLTIEKGTQHDQYSSQNPTPVRTPVYSVDKNKTLFPNRGLSLKETLVDDSDLLCITNVPEDDFKRLCSAKSSSKKSNVKSKLLRSSKCSSRSIYSPAKGQNQKLKDTLNKKTTPGATSLTTNQQKRKTFFMPPSPRLLKRSLYSQTMPKKPQIFDYDDIYNIINGTIKILKK